VDFGPKEKKISKYKFKYTQTARSRLACLSAAPSLDADVSKVQVVNSSHHHRHRRNAVHGLAITTLNINLFALTKRTESFPTFFVSFVLPLLASIELFSFSRTQTLKVDMENSFSSFKFSY